MHGSVARVNAPPPPRIRAGVRAAIPVALGPVFFGASFGVLAVDAGLSSTAAVVFSATTFAGSAQFAAGSVLETGGSAIAAIVAASFLNARYVPMSIAVASLFPGPAWRRLVESQLIVDESWAIAGRSGRFERSLLVGAGLLLYVLWVVSTAVGVLVGDRLGDARDLGLDAAFAVLFAALALPYLRTRRARQAAALAAAIVLVLLPVAPAGVAIVAASAACLVGLRR
jgi:4-azaleucine resistance transporter AzlC